MTFNGYNEIPQEIRDDMNYTCSAHDPTLPPLAFNCHSYEPLVGGAIRCTHVILECRRPVRDQTGKIIDVEIFLSHLDEMILGGTYAWFVRKVRLEER